MCKSCDREEIEGDKGIKYKNRIKRYGVILYLEGNGIRSIARILSSLFDGKVVSDEVASLKHDNKTIKIVEMDELFTYIKKNKIRWESGLLFLGTTSVYLNLKSAVQHNQ